MQFVISLLIFGVISVSSVAEQNSNLENNEIQSLPIKESVLLSLERTPCFGTCPTYKYTIFTTGKVIYHGEANVKHIGSFSTKLSQEQIEEIKTQIKISNIFSMQDKYDAKITDIPSTLLVINLDGKKKKIYDRHGAPDALRDFEKFIDKLVLKSKMTQLEHKHNDNRD